MWFLKREPEPTNSLEYMAMAIKYDLQGKRYRYFRQYEKKYGIQNVHGFWIFVLGWLSQCVLPEEGEPQCRKPLIISVLNPNKAQYERYIADDVHAGRLFQFVGYEITLSPELSIEEKRDIVRYVKENWHPGVIIKFKDSFA
jgi:hypothetical protein